MDGRGKSELVDALVDALVATPPDAPGALDAATEAFAAEFGGVVIRYPEIVDRVAGRIPSHGFPLPMCPGRRDRRSRAALIRSVRTQSRNDWSAAKRLGCWSGDVEVVQTLRAALPSLGFHAAVSLGYLGDVTSFDPIEVAWERCLAEFAAEDDLRSDEWLLFCWTYPFAALAWLQGEETRHRVADRIAASMWCFESPDGTRSVEDLVLELRLPRNVDPHPGIGSDSG